MKPISPTIHGAIDYLAVVIFAVAPAAIGLSGWPAAPRRASTGRLLAFVVLPIPVIFIEVLTKCQYQLKLKFALPE